MANTLNNEQGVVNAIHKLVEQQRAQRKQTERFQQALRSSFTDTMRESMKDLLQSRAFNEDARFQKQRDVLREFTQKEQKAQNRIDKMKDRDGFDNVGLMDVLNLKKWREATDQFRSEHNDSIAGKLMRSYRAKTGALSIDSKVALKAHKAAAYGELEDAIRDSLSVLKPELEKEKDQEKEKSDDANNGNTVNQELKEQKQLTVEQTTTLTEISQVLKQGLTTQPQITEKIADDVASINKQIVDFLQPAAGKNQQYSVEERVETQQTERTKVDLIKTMSNDIHTLLTITASGSKDGEKKGGGLLSGVMGALGKGFSFLPKLIGMGMVGLLTAALTDLKKMKIAVDIAAKAIPILLTMIKPIGEAVAEAVKKVLSKIPGFDDLFEHKPDVKVKTKIGDKPDPKTDPKKAPGEITTDKNKKVETPADKNTIGKSETDANKLKPKESDPAKALEAENRATIAAKGAKKELIPDATHALKLAKPLAKLTGGLSIFAEAGSALWTGKERFDEIEALAAKEGWTEKQLEEAKAKIVGETASDAAIGVGGATTGAVIGGFIGALGGPVGVALGSWLGGAVGGMIAEKVKDTDVGKELTQSAGGTVQKLWNWYSRDDNITPVKQDQQGNRMHSKASLQEKSGQTVVNVNTQNNNNNTAVNGGGTPQPPFTAVDDLDGVRRYAYSGNFIGTD
jgi:hypothetical protein